MEKRTTEICDTRPCPVCGETIKQRARKCVHCDSVLDWARYLGISNTTLALLTALVAVIAQAAPVVRSALEPKDSRLHLTFMGAGSRRAVLDGTIMNGDVVLLVSNDGAEAGGVVTGSVDVFWEAENREHDLSLALWTPGDEPEIVGPDRRSRQGSSRIPTFVREPLPNLAIFERWLLQLKRATR
jgi:hypothetical protein